ncbi:MAG: class II aldolase/adducin family protein [Candidatus Krumholzibacteriota bacterium]|nr:class II aldolase/adducin family protein [Candidatus Krumholzibacteriota bacterium]
MPASVRPEILERVAAVAARLDRHGWGEANGGNLSLQIGPRDLMEPFTPGEVVEATPAGAAAAPGGASAAGGADWPGADRYLLVTATGSRMHEIAADPAGGLCLLGRDGDRLVASAGSRAPTSELPSHRALHAALPPGGAVVHSHCDHLIALSHLPSLRAEGALEAALLPLMPETALFLGGIAALPFTMPGGVELAAATAAALGRADVMVWACHGALAVGPDLETALDRLELAEKAARVWWLIRACGEEPAGIPPDCLARLRRLHGGAPGGPRPPAGGGRP